ncbi:MAG: SpoIID/LytB domain-containing protein [Chloroflexi bacterium]|nr:SpoIID/LytB domain-containing protein [Chloroflexota bacterium]
MGLNRREFIKLSGAIVAGVAATSRGLTGAPEEQLLVASEERSGIWGTVSDIITGRAIGGAMVWVTGRPETAFTDSRGSYRLALPPGRYEVHVEVAGYLSFYRVDQIVYDGSYTEVNFDLPPANPTPEQQQVIYDKMVTRPQNPPGGYPEEWELAPRGRFGAAVTVPAEIRVRWPDGCEQMMSLDEYLKGVVPNEVPYTWHTEALKAQAVAARSYAVAYYQARGYICTTTSCQVYSDRRTYETNRAVDTTHDMVGTYENRIISAFYFSRCNAQSTRNSEKAINWQTCQESPWNYVPYCRARPCWGHAPYGNSCGYYGHGVGICQWGMYARANENWDYGRILTHYYTGIVVEGGNAAVGLVDPSDGAVFQEGTSLTLSWTGEAGNEFWVDVRNTSTAWALSSGWITSRTWPLGALGLGGYEWKVKTRRLGAESDFSGTQGFQVVNTVYRRYFPMVARAGEVCR